MNNNLPHCADYSFLSSITYIITPRQNIYLEYANWIYSHISYFYIWQSSIQSYIAVRYLAVVVLPIKVLRNNITQMMLSWLLIHFTSFLPQHSPAIYLPRICKLYIFTYIIFPYIITSIHLYIAVRHGPQLFHPKRMLRER